MPSFRLSWVIRLTVICLGLTLLPIEPADAADDDRNVIRLAYTGWSSALASTHVVKIILERELAYSVELRELSVAAVWKALAAGEADVTVAAWLPYTHAPYYKQFRDQVVDLGPNLRGARVGLVVPEYVPVSAIPDLNDVGHRFRNEIIGIDPDAGLMLATQRAMETYGIDMNLTPGSENSMLSVLAHKAKRMEWVVITGWSPHWMFRRWDLKYLDDPDGVYGRREFINTVVRADLAADRPGAYRFLDRFHWTPADISKVMIQVADGAAPEEAAAQWIDNNPLKVGQWLR